MRITSVLALACNLLLLSSSLLFFMPARADEYEGLNEDNVYVNDKLKDSRSSIWQSGVVTPREYFLPQEPAYDKIDPEEEADYIKTHYTPYAQLQIYHPVQVGKTRLIPGYYLVKINVGDAESQKRREKNKNPQSRKSFPSLEAQSGSEPPPQISFIIKQSGQVFATLPAESSEEQKKKLKKGSLAQLVVLPGNPITPQIVRIKYCVKNMCYQSAPLEPGLVQ